MKKTIITLAIATLGFTANANDKLSYNYAQFGLIHSGGEVTSDKSGYNIEASFDWTPSVYTKIRYNTQSADVWASGTKASVDATEYAISLGYHGAMTRSSDFYGELGLIKQDGQNIISQTTFGNDGDGFFAKLGVRTRWTANWESNIYAGYQDVDLASFVDEARYEDDDTIFGFEVRYYLDKTWSIGIAAGEEATGATAQINVRMDF